MAPPSSSFGFDEPVHPARSAEANSLGAAESLLDHQALERVRRRQLPPHVARRLIWEGATLLDVRTAEEFDSAHLKGAQHFLPQLEESAISQRLPDLSAPILCYSNRQRRGDVLVGRLTQLGYTHAYGIAGGLDQFLTTTR